MKRVLSVACGGALGALARSILAKLALTVLGPTFPWGTLLANFLGSCLIGVLVELLALRYSVSEDVRAFLVVGFLGGFTTFSAFSFEVIELVERNATMTAMAYASLSVVCSIGGVFAGMQVIRKILLAGDSHRV